ncbi:hypothetical protein [uncultured Sphingomonas sp.]|uniref:hypothetical protein n=1 Tax=uncultured Sphingomonas sp. TaxID=158754 RepID=UPI0025FAD212|nr:hypothetical protein [uncultured Sphingomonas sp.]
MVEHPLAASKFETGLKAMRWVALVGTRAATPVVSNDWPFERIVIALALKNARVARRLKIETRVVSIDQRLERST